MLSRQVIPQAGRLDSPGTAVPVVVVFRVDVLEEIIEDVVFFDVEELEVGLLGVDVTDEKAEDVVFLDEDEKSDDVVFEVDEDFADERVEVVVVLDL